MALVINDRVKETSTSTGNSQTTWVLDGAVTGFETFNAGIATTNTTYYAIFLQGSNEWEVGLGTLSTSTNLQRTTIITSSNSDNVVDFSAGTKDVFCTLPASKAVYLDADGDPVGVSGGQITDETKTFSNYSNITASRTLTLSSGTNYMLIGAITVDDTYTWDIAGTGELTLV